MRVRTYPQIIIYIKKNGGSEYVLAWAIMAAGYVIIQSLER